MVPCLCSILKGSKRKSLDLFNKKVDFDFDVRLFLRRNRKACFTPFPIFYAHTNIENSSWSVKMGWVVFY